MAVALACHPQEGFSWLDYMDVLTPATALVPMMSAWLVLGTNAKAAVSGCHCSLHERS